MLCHLSYTSLWEQKSARRPKNFKNQPQARNDRMGWREDFRSQWPHI